MSRLTTAVDRMIDIRACMRCVKVRFAPLDRGLSPESIGGEEAWDEPGER